MNPQPNFFARAILDYLDREGITREQLCVRIGVPYTTMQNWIKGRGGTSIQKMQEIADELGITFVCSPKPRD